MQETSIIPTENECEPDAAVSEKDPTWAEDQKKHSYYYDDAHGYEDFDPSEDTDDEDE